jgi:1-deoxy-D-xylulose-5-phosphate synthase
MMKFAVNFGKPIAIRYPRGTAYAGLQEHRAPIELGKAEWIYRESEVALFAVGSMVKTAETVRELLKAKGYNASLINARFVKPIDEAAVLEACENHKLIVSLEENVRSGGYGEKVRDCVADRGLGVKVMNVAIPDEYVEHGNVGLLYKEVGLDAECIAKQAITAYVGLL